MSSACTLSSREVFGRTRDRKSTRLNSSHSQISYAVFCLKKKIRTPTSLPLCLRRYWYRDHHPLEPEARQHILRSSSSSSSGRLSVNLLTLCDLCHVTLYH